MKKTTILIILLSLIVNIKMFAQKTETEIIDEFFENFEKIGPSSAIDKIYATNPWTIRIADAINNIKNQLKRFDKDLVGEYYGYEKLVTKRVGDSYVLHSYFVKYDRQFLRFTFQFYKPKNEWRLASFQFDDSFDDELEQAAKLYNFDLD